MPVSTDFIQEGSTGSQVTELQANLKKLGLYTGAVDGKFGAATKAAVIKFQKNHGLTPDGIVGQATWKYVYAVASHEWQ